jgi:aminoglycoside phosphotransferase (APT) family kinase protein
VSGPPAQVLDVLGVRPDSIVTLKDMPTANGSWLAETMAGGRVVLRRYHDRNTADDLAYEHAVLRHLAAARWVVPEPVGEASQCGGLTYCLTRYVPGTAVLAETIAAAGTWHGSIWRCATWASGSVSAPDGVPSTPEPPCTPPWTGTPALAR